MLATLDKPKAGVPRPPVDPGIVCRDQLTTEVTVRGEGFSPVPIGIPDKPEAALPSIRLTRSQALDGTNLSDPDEVVYSGNPDKKTKPTNGVAVVLAEPDADGVHREPGDYSGRRQARSA